MTVCSLPPTLVVVGADPGRAAAFAVWRRLGYRIVLIDGDSSDRYDALASETHLLDARDGSAEIDVLKRVVRHADGVVTLSDNSQITAARLAEYIGRPGPGVESAAIARSKVAQRDALRRAGIQVPRWRAVTDARDVLSFFEDGDRRAVIKPADASASAAVHLVTSAPDAIAIWPRVRQFSGTRSGIIEDFIEGVEISVEAVIIDGEVKFAGVTRKTSSEPGYVEEAHHVAPSAREPFAHRARVEVSRVARALNAASAIMHAEFKVSDTGWVMVETAVRPAGDYIPLLVRQTHGVDLYEWQARVAFGWAERDEIAGSESERYSAARFVLRTGRVRRHISPRECTHGLSSVRSVIQLLGPGRDVRAISGSWDRSAVVTGVSPDQQTLGEELAVASHRAGVMMFGPASGAG